MDYYATRLGFLRTLLSHNPQCELARQELNRLAARMDPIPEGSTGAVSTRQEVVSQPTAVTR